MVEVEYRIQKYYCILIVCGMVNRELGYICGLICLSLFIKVKVESESKGSKLL
jgi:hypothetical protein